MEPCEEVTVLREKTARKKREKKEKVQKTVKANRQKAVGTKSGAGRKKNGKAQEEKRRLTEELLRERRQMEARSFAQMRKAEAEWQEKEVQAIMPEESDRQKVCETEVQAALPEMPTEKESRKEAADAAVRAVEEAAATKVSYEMMLSDVLAEYLA